MKRVGLDRRGLVLDPSGERKSLPLLAGRVDYFQLPPRTIGRCLDAVCELGIEIVDTCVPWAVHELAPRRYGFAVERGTGSAGAGRDRRYNRDLHGFLVACHERGLKVILRPGPYVGAELTGGGYPWRLFSDSRLLARGPRGGPITIPWPPRCFPAPSYASGALLDQARHWLRAVAEAVSASRYPEGPIVAVRVDGGPTSVARTGAYDHDYHPEAVARYRAFLAGRYPDGLPEGYGPTASADSCEPPTRFAATSAEQLVPHLDWLAFRERLVVETLAQMAGGLRDGGLEGIALLSGRSAAAFGETCSIADAERSVQVMGLDLHAPHQDHQTAARAALRLTGSSRLPYLSELGWGGRLWGPAVSLRGQLSTALCGLMHGARGFSLHMAVERDRWFDAPIAADGSRREERWRATAQLLHAVRQLQLWQRSTLAPVGLVEVRDYRRLARCTSLVEPLAPALLELAAGLGPQELCAPERFGFADCVQRAATQLEEQVQRSLERAQLGYALVDSEVGAADLARFDALVVVWFEFIDAPLLARLRRFVDSGGTLLCGPRLPQLDGAMRPLTEPLPDHEPWATLEQLDEKLATLESPRRWPTARADGCRLETALLAPRPDDESGDAVLFIANCESKSCAARLTGLEEAGSDADGLRLWDGLQGTPVDAERIELSPHEVRMLRWRRGSAGAAR